MNDPDNPPPVAAAIVAFGMIVFICFCAAKTCNYILQKYEKHTQPVVQNVLTAETHVRQARADDPRQR